MSGVEGTFRSTAVRVMKLMRDNKDAVMAMLEAFVYDPLITWRLLPMSTTRECSKEFMSVSLKNSQLSIVTGTSLLSESADLTGLVSVSLEHNRMRRRDNFGPHGLLANQEQVSQTAKKALKRVYSKLVGTDFPRTPALDIESQVSRLIEDAASHENLCQAYVGWCPFW